MYLDKLTLNNFRSFAQSEIPLCKDLTLLVGENNGGKSNAIDAIRLLTAPLGGRRELYCETTDIRFGSAERKFELTATFAELNAAQQGRMISAATDATISGCVFGLKYDEMTGRFPIRPALWAGHQRGNPEAGCHEMVRHVYLPPLRDAKRALASGNPTRIYALLNHFLEGGDPEALAKSLRRGAEAEILGKVGGAVEIGLSALTAGVRRQAASLGFASDEKLIDIARDLRFKLADHGIEPEDLRYSGHGYANLLYMATIAVELEKVILRSWVSGEDVAKIGPQNMRAVEEAFTYRLVWALEAVRTRRMSLGWSPETVAGGAAAAVETGVPQFMMSMLIRAGLPSRRAAMAAIEDAKPVFVTPAEMRAWLESDEITAYTDAGDWPTPDTAALWARFRTEALSGGIQKWSVEHYKRLLDIAAAPPAGLYRIVTDEGDGRSWLATPDYQRVAAFKKSAVDPKPSLFSGRLAGNTRLVEALRVGRGKLRWPQADA